MAVAVGVYSIKGSPDVPSGRTEQNAGADDLMAVIEGLSARLEQEPDDINGWKMLGRSHMALGGFADAVTAFERAVELEDAQNAQTLVSLGVALAQAGGTQQLAPRAVSVFENAIALEPNNPEALFWSGFAAVSRGDTLLAADRWELLLANNPPRRDPAADRGTDRDVARRDAAGAGTSAHIAAAGDTRGGRRDPPRHGITERARPRRTARGRAGLRDRP